jgi:hypothetical protein
MEIARADRSDSLFRVLSEALLALERRLVMEGWNVALRRTRGFSWLVFNPKEANLPSQGWKIHVSIGIPDLSDLIRSVLPRIVGMRRCFKLPSGVEGILALNGGHAGVTQVGKIVTVYCKDAEEAAETALALDGILAHSSGPVVRNEGHIRPGGAVSLRYGSFALESREDEFGRPDRTLLDAHGARVPDALDACRGGPFPVPLVREGEPSIEEDLVRAGLGRFVPVTILRGGDKKMYLALDKISGRSVVVKQACRGVSGDLAGWDEARRLRNEYEMLSSLRKLGLRLPEALGYGSGAREYLVLEYIDGVSLDRLEPAAQLEALAGLAEQLARYHANGVVHRDVKLSNALKTRDGVMLIDVDVAAPRGAHDFAASGTRCYTPPEGVHAVPEPSYDLYGLGCAIAHALIQHDPAWLPAKKEGLLALVEATGHKHYLDLVRTCLADSPADRPSATEVKERLVACASSRPSTLLALPPPPPPRTLEASLSVARSTRAFLERTQDAGWWRNEHMFADFACEGINLGAAGVVLGLASIAEASGSDELDEDIRRGARWLAERAPSGEACGLFTGAAGVAVALTLAGARLGEPRWVEAGRARMRHAIERCKELDLFSGMAGVVYAAHLITRMTRSDELLAETEPMVFVLLDRFESKAGDFGWRSSGKLEPFTECLTGASHGTAGVALALALWGRDAGEATLCDFAVHLFDRIYRECRTSDGKTLRRHLGEDRPAAPLGAWCHGPAGYLWSMLLGIGDVERLREPMDWAFDCLTRSIRIENPTLCHGLAGQLETLRMAAQIERYRERAERSMATACGLLENLRFVGSAGDVWGSEAPTTVTPDLWVGFLGPAAATAMTAVRCGEALLSAGWLARCSRVAS